MNSGRVILRLVAIMTCLPEVKALKSPFVKGDLGGFSGGCEIPPTPLFRKGGLKNEFL
jgi:hypothetical protein